MMIISNITHTHTHTHMHKCIYACMHTYIHIPTLINIHTHTCAHTHARTLTHMHTHTGLVSRAIPLKGWIAPLSQQLMLSECHVGADSFCLAAATIYYAWQISSLERAHCVLVGV